MDPRVTQYEAARHRANHYRTTRAYYRHMLRRMQYETACRTLLANLQETLDGVSDCEFLVNARVSYVLEGLPLMGAIRVRRLLYELHISHDRRVGQLTVRQIAQIADKLPAARVRPGSRSGVAV